MFEKDEQKDLAAYLRDNYGFEVRVQHDYMMAAQNIEDRYVWLRRFDPDRWVSIWPLSADSTVVNFDSLVAIRNRMTKTWYEGDVVVEDETGFDQVDFRGEPTAKLTGTWKNDSLAVGGPFRMYAVYEPQDSLMYFIDIAVMAPGKLKKPYLDQLEVIASTFRLNEQAD